MTTKLKLGFIGCGYMGQLAHMAHYAALPDVELAALTDQRPKTREKVARRYGIDNVYASNTELLAQGNLDAVVAIMPFGIHYKVVPEILEAGVHCLTEKPVSVTATSAGKFAEIANRKNVIYQIGNMKRCDPGANYMKEVIREWRDSNEFGAFTGMRVTMPPGDWTFGLKSAINMGDDPQGDRFPGEEPPADMSDQEKKDYVSFINFYIHQVNLIRFLAAEEYHLTHVSRSGRFIVGETETGTDIVLEAGAYRQRHEWIETYTAFFEKGYVSMVMPAPMARQQSGKISLYKNTDSQCIYEQPVMPPADAMQEQARFFVETIRGERECVCTPEEAAKDLVIAEQFIRLKR